MSTEQSSSVMLTEAVPTVALEPGRAATGTLRISLTWEAQPGHRNGLLGRILRRDPIQLDLGCLYEYADGSKGVVQALGETFDDLHTFGDQPILWLDGAQRSGPESGGENLYVDLEYRRVIRRLLVFVFSYAGVPDWAAAEPVVTLHPVAGPRIEVPLIDPDSSSPLVAVALVERDGDAVAVHREVRWVRGGQQKLDELYGWGMEWRSARPGE